VVLRLYRSGCAKELRPVKMALVNRSFSFNSQPNSSSIIFSSFPPLPSSSSSSTLALTDTEDYTFLCYLKEIEIRYTMLPKSSRIRIEKWIEKLIEVPGSAGGTTKNSSILTKDRNLYTRLLLEMLITKSLSYPFTVLPNDGPLPSFPTNLKLRMKNFIGLHESLFWKDLYERLIPKQQNEMTFMELENNLDECREVIGELWTRNQSLEQEKDEMVTNYENEKKLTKKLMKKLENYSEMEIKFEDSQQVIEDLTEQIRSLEKILKQTQQNLKLFGDEKGSDSASGNDGPSLTWLHNSHAQFLEYQKIYEKFHLKVIHALKFTDSSNPSHGAEGGGHSVIQAKEKLNDLLIKQRDDYIHELLSHLETYNSSQESLITKLKGEWEKRYNDLYERYDSLQKDYSDVDRRKSDHLTKWKSLERIKEDLEQELDEYKKSNENLIKRVSYYQDMESRYEDSDQIIVDLKEQIKILEKTSQRTQQMSIFQSNMSTSEEKDNSPRDVSPSLTWLHNSHAQFLEYQKIYEKFHLKVIHALKFTDSSNSSHGAEGGGHSVIQAKEKLNDLLIKQRDDYIHELLSHLETYNSSQESLITKLKGEWEKRYNDLYERYDSLQKEYQLTEQKLTESEIKRQSLLSIQRNFEIQMEILQNKLQLYENYYDRLLIYVSDLEKQRLESSYSMESLVVNALNTLGQPLLLEDQHSHQRGDRGFSRSVLEYPEVSSTFSIPPHVHPPSFLPHQSPIKHRSSL
jgi:chromosome segregation ATPase